MIPIQKFDREETCFNFWTDCGKNVPSIHVVAKNNKGIRWFTVKIGVKRVFPIEMIDSHGIFQLHCRIIVRSKLRQNPTACKSKLGFFMRSEARSNLRVAPMRERHNKVKQTTDLKGPW